MNYIKQSKFFSIIILFSFFTSVFVGIKIDVNPSSNTLKIQLDTPPQYLLSAPKEKDISPVLTIGILSLELSSYTEKLLQKKYDQKKFNDFIFPGVAPTESGAPQILDFLQNSKTYSMIASSYTKYLSSYKNVYIVPLNIYSPLESIQKLMEGLDGVLLTGGSSNFYVEEKIKIDSPQKSKRKKKVTRKNSLYLDTVIGIFKKAKEINEGGRVYPVWATCLGFEGLVLSEAPADYKFDSFNDIKKMHSLVLTDPNGTSYMNVSLNPSTLANPGMEVSFKLGTQELKMSLVDHKAFIKRGIYDLPSYSTFGSFLQGELFGKQDEKIFYYYHHYGFTKTSFQKSQELMDSFNILAVSDENDFVSKSSPLSQTNDKIIYAHPLIKNIKEMVKANNGETTFIAAIEHKKYPFYGVQFHPEKPLYDYRDNSSVRHDQEAQTQNKKFSSFFIQRLRAAKALNIKNKKKVQKLNPLMNNLSRFQVNHVGLYSELYIFKSSD